MSLLRRIAIALIAATLLSPAFAIAQSGNQDQEAGQPAAATPQAQDPPARVGRLAFMEGQVSQFGEGSDDWVAAQLNLPVTGNTAFATGGDGRAEFELGAATARIDVGTELDVIALDEQDTDLRLPQGALAVDLSAPPANEAPVNTVVTTPRGDVTLAAPGHYLIAAGTTDQPTLVTVFDGSAQITDAANATFNVAAAQSGALSGASDAPTFAIQQVPPDRFVAWVKQRQALYSQAAALPSQVSPRMTGVVQLGAYGGWQTEAQYGAVWMPRSVPANWQPYRDGHWTYIRPWGWTWIDNQPWGFAPFHYGRWIRVHDRWAWAPGTPPQPGAAVAVSRPVYAPALVVFASSGGASAGAAGPAVAWYPLGWNEPYIPPYRVSRTYIEEVNIRVVERPRLVEVTNIYNRIYVSGGHFDPYQHLHVGAYRTDAVAVPRAAFVGAKPVARAAVKLDIQALRPAIRPVAVRPPPARQQPKLATAEPPKPKILPAAKRAPIPQKLMAPKAPASLRPAVAPGTAAPGRPAEAHPAARPAVAPTAVRPEPRPAAPPSAHPAATGPEAKPGASPPNRPAVSHPEATPEAKPGAAPPNRPAAAHPEAKPETNPAVAAPKRPEARQEAKPGATEPKRPAATGPEVRPESKPSAVPPNRPAAKQPDARHDTKPGVQTEAPMTRPGTHPPAKPGAATPANRAEPRRGDTTAAPRPAEARPAPKPAVRTVSPPERPAAHPKTDGAKSAVPAHDGAPPVKHEEEHKPGQTEQH